MAKRWLQAIVVLPVNVLVVIPGTALWITGYHWRPCGPVYWCVGLSLVFVGMILAIWTMGLFARRGEGTPAPWDPPQKLVIAGPYRRVRNPMIVGVLILLAAETVLLRSPLVFGWGLMFFTANSIYLPKIEERELAERFGEDYLCYKRHVPRWLPRWRAWHSG